MSKPRAANALAFFFVFIFKDFTDFGKLKMTPKFVETCI